MSSVREAIAALGRIHMVGIGGAGMSSMARVMYEAGAEVSGCDRVNGPALEALRSLGMDVYEGHSVDHLDPAPDLVVHTAAVSSTSDEVSGALKRGIGLISRAEMLGALVNQTRCLAVTGAHGKSTTSSMVATILLHADWDPSFFLGTELIETGSGGRLGTSDISVVEADEAFGSFLELTPHIAVMTNFDVDHLDFYRTADALKDAYRRFLGGCESAIVNARDLESLSLAPPGALTFGLSVDADISGDADVGHDQIGLSISAGSDSVACLLPIGGAHNAENALAAAAVCFVAGLGLPEIAEGLGRFRGAARRYELRGRYREADLIDDYAHLPREVAVTINRARLAQPRRIVAVFQPHTFTRTEMLWAEFGDALSAADMIIVTDVYAAREEPIPGVDGSLIVERVRQAGATAVYAPSLEEVVEVLVNEVDAGDVVLTMGAGDVTDVAPMLMARDA